VWCFLASARLRRIIKDYPQLNIVHHAFALAPDRNAIARMFGGAEEGKDEIMGHWAAAAAQPDGEAINVELMRSRTFPYPYSMPGLLACKAAEMQGGMPAHWDMFDRVQKAHAEEARNITDTTVLKDCLAEIGLDVARWEADFASPEAKQAVEADLREAQQLGVNAVPTLIFNERWILPGAVPESSLRQIVENLLEGKKPMGK
jgi:predicted DsbA family dithiol-disulfide isomerase